MSQVTRRGPVKPSLNITPLIDVVFLLIVFFMLVNNIVTDENPEMILPDPEDPEAQQVSGESRIIVNIVPEEAFEPSEGEKIGPGIDIEKVLTHKGRTRSGNAATVQIGSSKFKYKEKPEMEAMAEFVAKTVAQRLGEGKVPVVLLRADAGIYFDQTMIVLGYVQNAMIEGGLDPTVPGQTNINLVSYMTKE